MTDNIEWTTHLHDGSRNCPVTGDTLVRNNLHSAYYYRAENTDSDYWYGLLAYQIGTPRKPEVIEAVGYWCDKFGCAGVISGMRSDLDGHRITVTIEKRGNDYTATSVQMEALK